MQHAKSNRFLPVFFGAAACSWVPHWACHYYRLETGSSFMVGSWHFSAWDSAASMLLYSVLIGLNLVSIVNLRTRVVAAISSGLLHCFLGVLHIVRLIHPFAFIVFGYEWSMGASLREVLIVLPFGVWCLVVGMRVKYRNRNSQ